MEFLKTIFVFLLTRLLRAGFVFGLLMALLMSLTLWLSNNYTMQERKAGFAFAAFFFICSVVSFFLLCLLNRKKLKTLDLIDQKESLNLNKTHVLGSGHGTLFMAFDTNKRKLVVGNFATGNYRVHPFSYVRSWYADYSETVRYEPSLTGGDFIPGGGGMRSPGVSERVEQHSHRVIVDVKDIDNPSLAFFVNSEADANAWVSRLDAILNH